MRSSTVASFAVMIANLHIPTSGLDLAEVAIGVVLRLNIKYQTSGFWKTDQN
jgi:hypothetical protein